MNEVQFGFLMSAVAEMHAVNARVAGMIAANQQACGQSLSHSPDEFEAAAQQLGALASNMNAIAHSMGG